MAEYKGDKTVFLCVGPSDIPSDYSPEEQLYGRPLWICDQCHHLSRQTSKECEGCGEAR